MFVQRHSIPTCRCSLRTPLSTRGTHFNGVCSSYHVVAGSIDGDASRVAGIGLRCRDWITGSAGTVAIQELLGASGEFGVVETGQILARAPWRTGGSLGQRPEPLLERRAGDAQ